mmetsp:Transcript_9076/g.16341  ORF Transcript_9076/g.16341 Transcript_9076/m.16341 type:complete len:230 (-) Transcript_9076:397-1086(-)
MVYRKKPEWKKLLDAKKVRGVMGSYLGEGASEEALKPAFRYDVYGQKTKTQLLREQKAVNLPSRVFMYILQRAHPKMVPIETFHEVATASSLLPSVTWVRKIRRKFGQEKVFQVGTIRDEEWLRNRIESAPTGEKLKEQYFGMWLTHTGLNRFQFLLDEDTIVEPGLKAAVDAMLPNLPEGRYRLPKKLLEKHEEDDEEEITRKTEIVIPKTGYYGRRSHKERPRPAKL